MKEDTLSIRVIGLQYHFVFFKTRGNKIGIDCNRKEYNGPLSCDNVEQAPKIINKWAKQKIKEHKKLKRKEKKK